MDRLYTNFPYNLQVPFLVAQRTQVTIEHSFSLAYLQLLGVFMTSHITQYWQL